MAETEWWSYHGTDHFRQGKAAFVPPRIGGEDVVRLHLGCGAKKLRGYINIDLYGNPDVYQDCTALPYPENTADEIMAVHVLEHLFIQKVPEALASWYKVLKPGGKLVLEQPDLQKVLGFFKADNPNLQLTMFALYGGEMTGRMEDLHKWCWTFSTIKPILESVGYRDIVEKKAQYHIPERDFRVEATK